jgi:hypothetical protein
MKKLTWMVLAILVLTACQPLTSPPPIAVDVEAEFTLAPGQSATIEETGVTVTFVGVPGDARCPLEIECAESGPVTVAVTIQSGSNAPDDFTFYVFTDNDGSVPEMDFEGMTAGIEADGFVIRLKSVLPFPQKSFDEIGEGEYQASFAATKVTK